MVARDDHLDREPTEEVGEQVRVAAACGEVERLDGALVITPPARRARAEPARVLRAAPAELRVEVAAHELFDLVGDGLSIHRGDQ